MMKPYSEEDPELIRRRAIQAVYFDNSLTPAEKHQRILIIQGANDSDSDNMSLFTEGTGVLSRAISVSSKNSRGRAAAAAASATQPNRRKSTNSNKSSKSATTNNSKGKSKNLLAKKQQTTPYAPPITLAQQLQQRNKQELQSDSLSIYDAQQHEFVEQMEDFESVMPEEEEKGMKDIPLDDDHPEQAGLLLDNTKPKELNKTRSDGIQTQASTTEPAYDTASMNSSIDTHEQNKMMNKNTTTTTTTATAPLLVDKDKSVGGAKTFSYRKQRACGFCFCSLLLLATLCAPIVYFFRDWFAGALEPLTGALKGKDNDNAPVVIDDWDTDSPTSAPTKEFFYDPPTEKDCQDIANGNMKLQEGWILRRFQVPMDINLLYETTDVGTMTEMLTAHLQTDLAPVLAGCTEIVGETFLRRRLDTTRFVVGNAVVSAWHESDDVCATQMPTCYRVMVAISLYVQGIKTNSPLQDIVSDALDTGDESLVQQLDLPSPFDDIKVRGVYPAFTTESPTGRPSPRPSDPITASPTRSPVASATASPTVQASGVPTVEPTPGPTVSPTPFPTKEPIDCKSTLEERLLANGVTQLNQNAVAWMRVDQWLCNDNDTSILDRYALASLYLGLGGSGWTRKIQWMSANTVCDWQGVSCDPNNIFVTSLSLGGNQLVGNMPSELGLLTKLTNLDLDTNSLSGGILPELANLVELTSLDLANNALTGQVPDTFGNLISLVSLKVDSNQMRGGLTTQIGQLTQLSELSLSENQLSGDIPSEIGLLTVLERLNFSSNQFSAIPNEISNLVLLKSMEISSNKLKGEIPDLSGMAQLTLLRLDNNKLSGDLPSMPSSLTTCNLTKNKYKNNKNGNNGVCIVK